MYLVGVFKLEECDINLNGNYDIITFVNNINIKMLYKTNNSNIKTYLQKIINIIENGYMNNIDKDILLINYNENKYWYYRYKNVIIEIYINFILPNGYISITKYNSIQYVKNNDYLSPFEIIMHPLSNCKIPCLIMIYNMDTKEVDLIGIY